jgi:hypothetical protein
LRASKRVGLFLDLLDLVDFLVQAGDLALEELVLLVLRIGLAY